MECYFGVEGKIKTIKKQLKQYLRIKTYKCIFTKFHNVTRKSIKAHK